MHPCNAPAKTRILLAAVHPHTHFSELAVQFAIRPGDTFDCDAATETLAQYGAQTMIGRHMLPDRRDRQGKRVWAALNDCHSTEKQFTDKALTTSIRASGCQLKVDFNP